MNLLLKIGIVLLWMVALSSAHALQFGDKVILDTEATLSDDPLERHPRSIGGRPAKENEFPWMVALHYNGHFICSSFLVSKDFLMTSAECLFHRENLQPPERFSGYVGTINRDGPGTKILFNNITVHKEYGNETEYDIALMRLKTPIETNDGVQPICLPSKGSNFDDTMAQAIGWGIYEKGGHEISPVLLTVPEYVLQNAECKHTYAILGVPVTEKHMCAGGKGSGVCFGDSGGPLVNLNGTQPRAIGITSFLSSFGCAINRIPDVFTSTESYLDWITESMGDNANDLCYA